MSCNANEQLSRAETSLPRGAACLPCRRRKMRCDGAKPSCAQCISRNQPDDCEYASAQAPTRSQLLEENIALLEARIQEIENPGAPSSSVRLHAPGYEGSPPRSGSRPGAALQSGYQLSASATDSRVNLTSDDTHMLVDAFLPFASQLGFFLNIPKFLSFVRSSHRQTGTLLDVLVSTVCVWGSRFSNHPSVRGRQEQLLGNAIQRISDSVLVVSTGAQTHDVLAFIQAEILIANYFFSHGRLLEGRYHSSAALSLSLSCKLNLQQSIQSARAGSSTGTALLSGLPPPEGHIEVGERVNAFWTVHSLYKSWAIALESASAVWAGEGSSGAQIEIPWPLSMEACEKGQLSVPLVSARGTVQNFLRGGEVNTLVNMPPLSLHARAAVLFTRASWLASKFKKNMSDEAGFYGQFQSIHGSITDFLEELVALEAIRPLRLLLVISILARTALVRLHEKFATTDSRSRDTCLTTANGMLGLLRQIQINELGYLDPIMAILLTTIGQVYTAETARYKRAVQGPPSGDDRTYVGNLMTSAQQLLSIMSELGTICPLMATQAEQFRSTLSAV